MLARSVEFRLGGVPAPFYAMSAAVCLPCGNSKTGAWSQCSACGHRPETLEDRARHLMVTDRYLKPEVLARVAEGIRAGVPPQFVEDQVRQVAAEIARLDAERPLSHLKQNLGGVRLTIKGRLMAAGLLLAVCALVWWLFFT